MDDARRCHAKSKRSQQRCGRAAIRGGTVCNIHGGKTPSTVAKAAERLQLLVHPAITGLAELIAKADSDSVRLSAIRDLLDRTGYKPAEKIQAESEVTIRWIDEDQPIILEQAHALSNGTGTHD
jgi:hypothetical protein